jgi:hypothetical protein
MAMGGKKRQAGNQCDQGFSHFYKLDGLLGIAHQVN